MVDTTCAETSNEFLNSINFSYTLSLADVNKNYARTRLEVLTESVIEFTVSVFMKTEVEKTGVHSAQIEREIVTLRCG